MAVIPTDELMTSDVTPHRACRLLSGLHARQWTVSWLDGRLVDRNQAITALTIAEAVADPTPFEHVDALISSLASELGLTGPEAVRLVTEAVA